MWQNFYDKKVLKHMIRCMPVNLLQMWWLWWTFLSWKAFKRSHKNACWWISSNCDNCDEPLCPEKHLKFMQFISLWSYLCICFSIVVHLSSMMVRFLLLKMHKCGVSLILNLPENLCNMQYCTVQHFHKLHSNLYNFDQF